MQVKFLMITNVDFDVIGQPITRFFILQMLEKKWDFYVSVHLSIIDFKKPTIEL
jgi:hypothetical protein